MNFAKKLTATVFVLAIFFASTAYSKINDMPAGATYTVEDFGAKADGKTDSTASIQNAINAAINYSKTNGRRAEVVLGAGTYKLACPNPSGTPAACLQITGAQGITFRGQGINSTKIIITNPYMGLLYVLKSEDVTVSLFTLDYDPIPLAQGTIQSADANSFNVLLDDGYLDFTMPLLGDAKFNDSAFGALFDSKITPPTLKKNVSSWFKFSSFTQISKTPNVWKLNTPYANSSFTAGDRFAFPGRVFSALTFWDSSNVLLNHVQLLAAPGAATIMGLITGEIEIDDYQVRRVPGRLISTAADALHLVSNTAKLTIRNSIIESMLDDAINVYNHGRPIDKIFSNTQLQFSHGGYNLYALGQTLQFVDAANKIKGEAVITQYNLNPSNNMVLVTLSRAIPNLSATDTVYNIDMASPGAVIENNTFNAFRGLFRIRSRNAKFVNNVVNNSGNAEMLADSDTSYIEGPALNVAEIIFEKNTIQGETFKIMGNDKTYSTTPITECRMTIATCPLNPTVIGKFLDNNNGSSSNQTVCMQRATDYYNWCGIKPGSGQTVTADYLLDGVVQKTTTIGAVVTPPTPASGCKITLSSCPQYPATASVVDDNYNGSASNQTMCMQRATDFYNWCGIKSGAGTIKAEYLVSGVVQKTVTVGTLPTVVTCSSFTYSAYGTCQSNNTQSRTVATSLPAGCTGGTPVLTQACTYTPTPAPTTGCKITLSSCPQYPNTASVVDDNYNGSASNQAVCMQRATDFYNWCGIKSGAGTVKADYLTNGTVQKTVTVGTGVPVATCSSFTYSAYGTCQPNNTQTRTVATSLPAGCTGGTPVLTQACTYVPTPAPTTGCKITVSSCPQYPTTPSTVDDVYNGSASNQTVCMQRATDYYNWCAIKSGQGTIKAEYLSNGAVQKTVTVGTGTPPVVTCSSFTYSAYGACQSNNTQSRTVATSLPAGCTGGTPVLTQTCTYAPPVTLTVPGAPTSVFAIAGESLVKVNFTPPLSDGGSPITSYTLTTSNGRTIVGNSSPIIVDGLNNGDGYTFTLKANNSVGASLSSGVSNKVIPTVAACAVGYRSTISGCDPIQQPPLENGVDKLGMAINCDQWAMDQISLTDCARDLDLVKNLGIGSVRMGVKWHMMVRADGSVDPQKVSFMKALLNEARTRGMKIYFLVDLEAPTAAYNCSETKSPPTSPSLRLDFCDAAFTSYFSQLMDLVLPFTAHIELFNETNWTLSVLQDAPTYNDPRGLVGYTINRSKQLYISAKQILNAKKELGYKALLHSQGISYFYNSALTGSGWNPTPATLIQATDYIDEMAKGWQGNTLKDVIDIVNVHPYFDGNDYNAAMYDFAIKTSKATAGSKYLWVTETNSGSNARNEDDQVLTFQKLSWYLDNNWVQKAYWFVIRNGYENSEGNIYAIYDMKGNLIKPKLLSVIKAQAEKVPYAQRFLVTSSYPPVR